MIKMRLIRILKITSLVLVVILSVSCYQKKDDNKVIEPTLNEYDMRDGLTPSRLTIAMWDFSWLTMHYPGGAFENYDKVTDELLERGFNAVRIDAFPLLIGKLENNHQKLTILEDRLGNWGPSDKDRKHAIIEELLEFIKIAKEKNISVILSSWGFRSKEFPNIKEHYTDVKDFWKAWEKVLDLLKKTIFSALLSMWILIKNFHISVLSPKS